MKVKVRFSKFECRKDIHFETRVTMHAVAKNATPRPSLFVVRLVDWLFGGSVVRSVGGSVVRSVGGSVVWSVGGSVVWSVGGSVVRSVGGSVVRSVGQLFGLSVG